jgi:hypothetical protein
MVRMVGLTSRPFVILTFSQVDVKLPLTRTNSPKFAFLRKLESVIPDTPNKTLRERLRASFFGRLGFVVQSPV